jgi:autotransporter-associated beta strand protein
MGVGNGANNSSTVTIASGATLKLADNLTQTTILNPITGSGKIVKDGTYAANFNGAFASFSGDLTINGGKVSVISNGDTFNLKTVSGSGDLELRLAGSTSGSNTYLSSLTKNLFTGKISLVQSGNANGNKLNTGGKTFEGFTFNVNNGTSIYIAGSQFKADVLIAGNGNYENRGSLRIGNTISGSIALMADANIGIEGNGRLISGPITSGAASGETTLFINGKTDGTTVTANRDAGTFTGAISDGNSGAKLGLRIVANTQTFSGALSYTGATTINAGTTMNLSGADANLVNSRAVTVNGKLDFSNYTGSNAMQLNDLSGTTAAAEIIGTNKNLILNNNNDTSFSGKFRLGNGSITTSGTGTLTLTAKDAALYSGGITLNSSIASSADQTFHNLSGSGDIAFSNNSNLTLTGSPQSNYSGNITGVNTLTVQQNSAYDFSGATVSAANFEVKEGTNVSVSSEKPITVTESFRQGNNAKFAFSGGSAAISGANVAQQATIALNGGTMSINSYDYTAPELPNYGGLVLHLDASDASSFDNSESITTWKNLANSSNNLTFTNIKGNVKASVTHNVKAGLDVVTFPTSGTAYYDLASVINGRTYFAVMTDNGYTSSSDNSFLFANKGDSAIDGHNPYCYHRGNGTVLWNTTHVDANIKNGVTSLNGTAVPCGSANIGTDWNVLSIQTTGTVPLSAISRERSGVPARGWRGDIAEILVYTEALTNEQVQEISKYLATKWQVGNDIVEPTVVTTGEFVSTNAINVVADSTIDVAGFSSVTFDSTSIDEGKTLTVNVAEGQETVWTSPISGAGGFTKSGAGTLTLSEAPAYNGATTVESGTLALTEGGTLNNLSGGSLNPNGTIAQSATLDATGKDLTLVNSETTKFIGSIKANNIVANGEGTLQIYTGAEGQVDAQSLTVSSGEFDLKGYMTGSIEVDSNTVFSPGNSVGEAVLGGSFILNAAAILLMEQDSTGMDKLTASSFEIDPNAILELTVGAAIPGATYDIIFQKNGDTAVDFTGDQATDDFWNSLLTSESAYYWNLSVNGNVVSATLDANAVPEPSTWALLILGVVVLFLRKRVRS